MVKAVDFNGSPYFQKGMVTLIRWCPCLLKEVF